MVWQTLSKRLQASNRSRVIQLKNDLHHVSMKNNSMQQYLSEIKNLVDLLAAAGAKVDSEDVVLYTLNGLPSPYQSFKTAIRTRLEPISLDDFYALLCSEETILAAEVQQQQTTTQYALQAARGRGRTSYNRGRGRHTTSRGRSSNNRGRSSPNSALTCQICGKFGHSAYNCWHRANLDYCPPTEHQANSASLTTNSSSSTPAEWYLDSGASAHLTANYQHLQQPQSYSGGDQVTVGNGSTLPITHTGHNTLSTDNNKA